MSMIMGHLYARHRSSGSDLGSSPSKTCGVPHAWRSRPACARANFVQVPKDPVGAGTRCSPPGGDQRDLAERLCQAGATLGAMALGVHACMWSVPTAISASAANLPISKPEVVLHPDTFLARTKIVTAGGPTMKSGYGWTDMTSPHPSCELGAAALGDQEKHRQDVESVERRQHGDGELEAVGGRKGTDHDWSQSADGAADVEQNVLGRCPRGRREQLAYQGAVPAEHAVDEEPHHGAAEEEMHRVGQTRVQHDGDGRSDHVTEEGRPAADSVGDMPEKEDAHRHAGDRHRGPDGRLREREIEAGGKIVRQPDHHAVVAKVLHRTENHQAEAELHRLPVLDQQAEGRPLRPILALCHEYLRLMQ